MMGTLEINFFLKIVNKLARHYKSMQVWHNFILVTYEYKYMKWNDHISN